jgi:hypothetical protein
MDAAGPRAWGQASFSLGPHERTVRVRSRDRGLLAWLAEALVPPFAVREGGAEAEIVVHSEPFAGGTGRSGSERWPCYALGEHVVWLPGWRDGSTVVVDDDHFGVRLVVGHGRVELHPLGPPRRTRPAAFRVVRELLSAPRGSAGRLELHAAALALDGGIVAFAGPKSSGKTTTLARMTSALAAEIVANDRLYLTRDDGGLHASGIPTFVRLRSESVRLLPGLFAGLDLREHRLDSTIAELEGLPPTRPAALASAYGFTPAQFAHMLGTALHPGGTLACLAFLSVDPALGDFVLAPLDARTLERRFGEAARVVAADEPPTIFERCLGYEQLDRNWPLTLEELVALVPCFELRVGPGFLVDGRPARRLASELLTASVTR